MTDAAPHPFKAVVDPLREIDESNEGNNESAVINVGVPRACSTGD
jgi:subtilase family serine protease